MKTIPGSYLAGNNLINRRIMKKLVIALTVILLTGTIVSCRKKPNPLSQDSLVEFAIAEAEAEVPVENNTILGEVPSLQRQYSRAHQKISHWCDSIRDELMKQSSDNNSPSRNKKISQQYEGARYARDGAWEKLEAIYSEKIDQSAKEFIGKEIPVAYDNEQFQAASIKVTKLDIDDLELEFYVRLEKPIYGWGVPWLKIGLIDNNNQVVEDSFVTAEMDREYQKSERTKNIKGAEFVDDFNYPVSRITPEIQAFYLPHYPKYHPDGSHVHNY